MNNAIMSGSDYSAMQAKNQYVGLAETPPTPPFADMAQDVINGLRQTLQETNSIMDGCLARNFAAGSPPMTTAGASAPLPGGTMNAIVDQLRDVRELASLILTQAQRLNGRL